MKIAVSASAFAMDLPVDQRFGRTPGFIVYDSESQSGVYIDNQQNLNAAQGAGIQTAQNVVRAGAQAVITGHTGPKAFHVLKTASIPVYHAHDITIQEAINRLMAGQLSPAESSDVEGHWV